MTPNSRSYLNHFTQPDTIVPEQSQGVQAWDRYAYTNNNPLRYTDPTGHCFDGISTVICLGFAIGAGINLVSQLQETGDIREVNWGEVVVSGAIGAVAGVVGAAVIAPAAAVAGASVTAATGSALTGAATELAVGGFMGGTANVILNNTQRAADHLVNGEEVTLSGVQEEFENNYLNDMAYGAGGFAVGKALTSVGQEFWEPHEFIKNPPVFGEPLLSAPHPGAAHLLNPHPAQNIVTGLSSTLANTLSNSTLIEYWHKRKQLDIE